MIDRSFSMVGSLAVAVLTRSHVTAKDWVDWMAQDSNSFSMVVGEFVCRSVVRMPARRDLLNVGSGRVA